VGVRETHLVRLLPVRVVWLALPLTAGTAAAEALGEWDDAPRVVGAALLFLAWGIGLVALLAPRPTGVTALRVIAPTFAVLGVAVALASDASTVGAVGGILGTVAAALLVADPAVALAAANAIAYGDERRYPLRVPPALYLAPVPLARAVVAAGVACGPLLLADGSYVAGGFVLVGGLTLAWFAARSLQSLVRRWLVLVPAGIAVVDGMTLVDPVLFVRRTLRGVRDRPGTAEIPDGVTDLRLGATLGTVVLETDGSVDVVRASRRGRPSETLHPDGLLLALAGRADLLARLSPVGTRRDIHGR
jgi:hypothetical protein